MRMADSNRSTGPDGMFSATPSQPAIARQSLRRHPRQFDGEPAFLVIRRDIGEPRRQPAPPPACLAFGTDDPAAQLDRFLPGQRCSKHRIRRIEQMMAFVEDDPRRPAHFIAPARGVDHHQRVVGDDDIGLRAGAVRRVR